MQAFCSTSLRVITGPAPALTTIILAPASAQAHWGHLGELAGHGHWIAAGLAAAGRLGHRLGRRFGHGWARSRRGKPGSA